MRQHEMSVASLEPSAQRQLDRFKAYTVDHPILTHVDTVLMRAIREPAGLAHVLVYGPSGVGKSTMVQKMAKRWQEATPPPLLGEKPPMPLLVIEARPPDVASFNRADYYRIALSQLGETVIEQRSLVDLNAEPIWVKKGQGRKPAAFNDSPELRHALEEALRRHGVRAIILDEAQHLMKVSTGERLLDQLDWLKSLSNVTGTLHLLFGTYDLLAFRNLSGQAARRGLDVHFARYLYQHQEDRENFQGVLLALLKEVPLEVDLDALIQRWQYFYERSIGCVGILKDWLVRTIATTMHDGGTELTLAQLREHALTPAQCERMAMEAAQGEQELGYTEQRLHHLWSLLGMDADPPSIPLPTRETAEGPGPLTESRPTAEKAPRPGRRKRQPDTTTETRLPTEHASEQEPTKPVRRRRRAAAETEESASPASLPEIAQEVSPAPVKRGRRVGERYPQRDPVGE